MFDGGNFVVFLDVDGVLNTKSTCVYAPSGTYVGVDEARLKILSHAMKETDADGVILTTTWKNMPEDNKDYLYLMDCLDRHGIKILGKTEEENVSLREQGILKSIKELGIDEFVILDDQPFGYKRYSALWEGFIDTRGRGIEHGVAASRTSSVSVMLFLDAIRKHAKD